MIYAIFLWFQIYSGIVLMNKQLCMFVEMNVMDNFSNKQQLFQG